MVDRASPDLFDDDTLPSTTQQVLRLALPPGLEHFDELRGQTPSQTPPSAAVPTAPAASPAAAAPGASAGPAALSLAAGVKANPAAQNIPPASTTPSTGNPTTARATAAAPASSSASSAPRPTLAPHWTAFFEHLGAEGFADLNPRAASLARQIRDNGVSYNVYADASGPQRPWSLDLFPFIVTPEQWQHIEAGVLQRTRLLEQVMADVYGPQRLLKNGLLPPALVQGHSGYLRAMHGVAPVGGVHLHIAAFDLARGPDGHWWIVSQRTQAPSGLGYLLENRLAISRQFPQAFEGMRVQHLAATYRALIEGFKRMSAAHVSPGQDAHIALLTPGPYNETYFEHAYLARYLGLTLVEGHDLTVRDQKLYLKTLRGLEPVHVLLKRLDDEFLDPLELRPDSTLGVPGLLQAIRAGNVIVANAPGSAFLESGALLGFLPALSRELLGETLSLPALPTWWCGEEASVRDVQESLAECVIKPTYPAPSGASETVLCRQLKREELDQWMGRLLREGEKHTVQSYLPLSQTPTWHVNRIAPRPALMRVFAMCDGLETSGARAGQPRWRVLPGGLTRLATRLSDGSAGMASMQRGGSSADTWVLTSGEVDRTTLIGAPPAAMPASRHEPHDKRKRLVTSRAGENLYWLGRYTERAENALRLARLALDSLSAGMGLQAGFGEQETRSTTLLDWLSDLAQRNSLVPPGAPSATQARRVFARTLIANLGGTQHAASVGQSLRALKTAAFGVRERLSQEHWKVITEAETEFTQRSARLSSQGGALGMAAHNDYAVTEALRLLDATSIHLAAITGGQTDRMTRDDGWRLLSIGRHIERLSFLAPALSSSFASGAVQEEDGGFESLLALFDSTITFRAQHQLSHDTTALLDLLLRDTENPRSLRWVVQNLQKHLARLSGLSVDQDALAALLPADPAWALGPRTPAASEEATSEPAENATALQSLLADCEQAAWRISDEISQRYFTHAGQASQSLEL
ncbi:circularly permuted type 2 ATP-grasp protein [Hylemonella gracilis]|uniref:Uncharacterized protein n=1 Tax=Hylemonella gracilis ATCC 19624 TaxID=887062 RepID=F3KPB0_9BURK|nr:circularly permuted type 2 ATP-grasp protein [Hylemonella gracilis]EGI78351.1 hypothetical protein HGR_01337 [Hylemonella gracilis ATCC 19624]